MSLSPRQRATLQAVCDTFVPSLPIGPGVITPSATQLGAAAAVEEAIALAPRAADRRQTEMLLSLFGTRGLTALGGGGLERFAALPQEERERVMLSWADSKVPQRRAVFQALRKAAVGMSYMVDGAEGEGNPLWELIGYPGPPGPETNGGGSPHQRLQPLAVRGDTTLVCDVVVVGSGAGGGVSAAVLAQAGLDVVVVEAGSYHAEDHFDGAELEGYQDLYLNGGGLASDDQSIALLAGSCLGGGTVVNYTTSFRTPDDVREEWAAAGVSAFAGDDYTRSMDAVCERLGVNREHNTPGRRDHLMQTGLDALGWHSDFMPRNVRGCKQDERCGYCGYGCPYGAKQSGLVTWLQDATAAGGRILVDSYVQRITQAAGRATGVVATHAPTGSTVTISSRAVVVAAGALHTPALLKRSKLANPNIGRHLRLHPATAMWGVFDEEVAGWGGTLQAVYSDQHADLDGHGYGLKYETAPVHPSLLFTFAPWRSARQHFTLMQALPHTSVVGVLLRDRDGGEVRVGRDGQPVVRYALSAHDAGHLRQGIRGAAEILRAAGAQRMFSSHAKLCETDGDVDDLVRQADAAGYGSGQITLASFHIMGSARMGGHPTTSACDPTGQSWDVRDVVIADGSAFPTASGVNPQISIMSIADMNARALAARLT